MSEVLRALATALLIAVALTAPAIFWQLGLIDREATVFVRQYTDSRAVLTKVFDAHANDLGTYQARELSYFIDFVDAQFYRLVSRHIGRAFLIPLSALLASFSIVAIFLAARQRVTPGVGFASGALLLLSWLTSFSFISTMGVFYRSSKPVLSAVVIGGLFHIHAVSRRRASGARGGTFDAALTFVLAMVAGLLDRQGFIYVIAACAILFVHVRRTGELRDILKAAVAAAIALTVQLNHRTDYDPGAQRILARLQLPATASR